MIVSEAAFSQLRIYMQKLAYLCRGCGLTVTPTAQMEFDPDSTASLSSHAELLSAVSTSPWIICVWLSVNEAGCLKLAR